MMYYPTNGIKTTPL